MKALIFALIMTFIGGNYICFTQTSAQGIYLSGEDFNNNKISYSPIANKKYKFYLNEVFNNSIIKVIIDDSSYTFYKDSIFAYQDKENKIYRFYGRETYQILNPKEKILLYSQSFSGGYKNLQIITKYYFSSSPVGKIQALTKWNLKKSFPTDSTFHELLDIYFKTDDELINYDSFYKMYKINRAYQFPNEEKRSR